MTVVTALVEFFVVVAFALAAVLLNTIDARGFLASTTVGFAVVYGGGFSWFVIVAVFFSLGVVFTLYKYGYKRRLGSAQGKGGARNWPHILANGGLASIAAIWSLASPGVVPAVVFLGAVSTSAADTVATELGLLSHSQPMLITHPSREVTPGTSGGVTPLGFVGAAFLIGHGVPPPPGFWLPARRTTPACAAGSRKPCNPRSHAAATAARAPSPASPGDP